DSGATGRLLMKSFKRFALSASTRCVGLLLSLLFIAPLTRAEVATNDALMFDVPEPGESITINLLQQRAIDPVWFIKMANFQVVSPDKTQRFLQVDVVGEY